MGLGLTARVSTLVVWIVQGLVMDMYEDEIMAMDMDMGMGMEMVSFCLSVAQSQS